MNESIQVSNDAYNRFYQEQSFSEYENKNLEMTTHANAYLFLFGGVIASFSYVFIGFFLIIVIMSIMLILQGLANQTK